MKSGLKANVPLRLQELGELLEVWKSVRFCIQTQRMTHHFSWTMAQALGPPFTALSVTRASGTAQICAAILPGTRS